MEKSINNSNLSSKISTKKKRKRLAAGMPIAAFLVDTSMPTTEIKKQEERGQNVNDSVLPKKIIAASMPICRRYRKE